MRRVHDKTRTIVRNLKKSGMSVLTKAVSALNRFSVTCLVWKTKTRGRTLHFNLPADVVLWLPFGSDIGIEDALTQDFILKCLGRTDSVMSVAEAEPFYAKYRLTVKVVDLDDRTVYEYTPSSRNTHLNSVVFLLQHNAHVTLLSEDMMSYSRKEFKPKTMRYLDGKRKQTEVLDLEGLGVALQNPEVSSVYYRGEEDVFAFCLSAGREPLVHIDKTNTATSFTLMLPHRVNIQPATLLLAAFTLVRDAAMQPNFKSQYSPSLKRAINDLKRGHLKRSFVATHDKVATLDMVRCYSARLKEIDFFPRFHKTDVFRPFDGVLQPHAWYIVRNDDCSPERYLILNQSTNLVSGVLAGCFGVDGLGHRRSNHALVGGAQHDSLCARAAVC